MWDGKIAQAITHYESGLILPMNSDHIANERIQYMKYRLASAYSLSGQQARSDEFLKALKAENATSELMQQLISYTPVGTNSYWKCMAAYNTFDIYGKVPYNEPGDIDYPYNLPTDLILGQNLENRTAFGWDLIRPDPRLAGCDPKIAIENLVSTHKFTFATSPFEQLRLLGLTPVQSQTFDLNKDRRDEWLIWLDVPTPPLFLTPDPASGTYTVSFAPIPENARGASLNLRPLPENLGNVLIGNVPITSEHSCPALIGQDPTFAPPPRTAVRIWRLINGRLETFVEAPVCDPSIDG